MSPSRPFFLPPSRVFSQPLDSCRPLFSIACALFCSCKKSNFPAISSLRPLCQKTAGYFSFPLSARSRRISPQCPITPSESTLTNLYQSQGLKVLCTPHLQKNPGGGGNLLTRNFLRGTARSSPSRVFRRDEILAVFSPRPTGSTATIGCATRSEHSQKCLRY